MCVTSISNKSYCFGAFNYVCVFVYLSYSILSMCVNVNVCFLFTWCDVTRDINNIYLQTTRRYTLEGNRLVFYIIDVAEYLGWIFVYLLFESIKITVTPCITGLVIISLLTWTACTT